MGCDYGDLGRLTETLGDYRELGILRRPRETRETM